MSGFRSARDDQGHGSHVASIAAGQSVRKANFNGVGKGVARGGAPHAHLAVYKVCWSSPLGVGCDDADLLAGLDAAVADGVDVLSISIVRVCMYVLLKTNSLLTSQFLLFKWQAWLLMNE